MPEDGPPPVRLLSRSDVARLLTLDDCLAAVENAFRLHAEGRSLQPAVLGVPASAGGFHVKAAGLDMGRAYFAAKVNANFPGNPDRGRAAIQGLVILCDAGCGDPLAVMDAGEITALRTGAATAAAARRLARPDSSVAVVCGCGRQGGVQLQALARVLPLRRAWAFDVDRRRRDEFARRMTAELGFAVAPADDLPQALRQSDVCVTCTPSRRAFVMARDVRPGTFVAAVGADAAGKQELDPRLVASSTLVVDVLEQCAEMGELQHALSAGLMDSRQVHAELAEVIAGRRPGRTAADEVVVFDSTGTALEDVAAAAVVFEKAQALGAGVEFEMHL